MSGFEKHADTPGLFWSTKGGEWTGLMAIKHRPLMVRDNKSSKNDSATSSLLHSLFVPRSLPHPFRNPGSFAPLVILVQEGGHPCQQNYFLLPTSWQGVLLPSWALSGTSENSGLPGPLLVSQWTLSSGDYRRRHRTGKLWLLYSVGLFRKPLAKDHLLWCRMVQLSDNRQP